MVGFLTVRDGSIEFLSDAMPTRILREGIITSESVNLLSEKAELLYRRLMSVVDDYGRFYSHPGIIRASCYPLRLQSVSEANVKQLLSEILEVSQKDPLLKVYGDGKYIQLLKFRQQTRSKSKFPEPTENELLSNCESTVNQMCSESESDAKSKTYAGVKPLSDEEWVNSLKANPAYSGIDVVREFGKMGAWCSVKGKQPTRRRFINWLNNVERPVSFNGAKNETVGGRF